MTRTSLGAFAAAGTLVASLVSGCKGSAASATVPPSGSAAATSTASGAPGGAPAPPGAGAQVPDGLPGMPVVVVPPPLVPPGPGAPPATPREIAAEDARLGHARRDGPACLAALDRLDGLEPLPTKRSRAPESPYAQMRAMCMMLAGSCAEGMAFYLESAKALSPPGTATARTAEALGGMYCQGPATPDRVVLQRAQMELTQGAYLEPKDPAFCRERMATLERLAPRVQDAGPDDPLARAGDVLVTAGPTCLAKAGACGEARTTHARLAAGRPEWVNVPPERRAEAIARVFEALAPACAQALPVSPR